MKYTKYILLLLLTASCGSRQSIRHRSNHEADVRPGVPVVTSVPTPVVVEEEEGPRLALPVPHLRDDTTGALRL